MARPCHRQACCKQLKSGQASREQGEGWRERGNQSLPSPRSQFTYMYFLQSERHYLGQDDENSTTHTLIVNVNFILEALPLIFKLNLAGSLCFLLSVK